MTHINEIYPIKLLPHRVEFHAARPDWEGDRLRSMFSLVQPGWCIYDLGAEEGDFTALYRSWVGDTGNIVAVEPSPGYWPAIRQTWELNGFTGVPVCVPAFVGPVTSTPEISDFFTEQNASDIVIQDDGWPLASRWPVKPDYGFRMLCERVKDTPVVQVDDLVSSLAFPELAPDAIVMDIEGAEYHALLGCERTCRVRSPKRPLLWVSVHETNMMNAYEKELGDIIRLVISWDYDYRYLGTHGGEDFWLFSPSEWTL